VSLGELIQLNEKNRRSNSDEGPVPSEAETSLDLDPKLEKKVFIFNKSVFKIKYY
jgi:hypothetical protein